jgi:crotonobetainyl-CoA:carnitine CoA-transferase CaiB-like acyl-CoA transferase
MAGIAQLTGYPDGLPQITGWALTDPLAGVNGMIAVMFALLHRQTTGKGQYIDLSQTEAITCMIGDVIVDYSMNKRVQPRRGNRHPFMAPHGCYRCKGDDLWVGIAVASDKEWKRFCKAIGDPPWTGEERFADSLSRWQNQDDLDKLIEEWTVQHDHYEVMNTLQKAGVAAGVVPTPAEVLSDPHLKERGTFQTVDRAIVGPHPYPIPSAPMKFSKSPVTIRRPAPTLGEHNEYVLGELLGMSKEEIQSLVDDQIIGTTPVGL